MLAPGRGGDDSVPHDAWMAYLSDHIGDRKLRDIALPGSHDSGMNKNDLHSCHIASECNTVTQTGNIGAQLDRGARYFDIRPVIHTNSKPTDWCTGHFQLFHGGFWGCYGEDRNSIIDDLLDFFSHGNHLNELVILNVSHCYTLSSDNQHHCDGYQNYTLINDLLDHLSHYIVKCDDNCNLMDLTFNEILRRRNIIVLVEGIESHKEKGLFHLADLPVYDHYSNTESSRRNCLYFGSKKGTSYHLFEL